MYWQVYCYRKLLLTYESWITGLWNPRKYGWRGGLLPKQPQIFTQNPKTVFIGGVPSTYVFISYKIKSGTIKFCATETQVVSQKLKLKFSKISYIHVRNWWPYSSFIGKTIFM